MKEMTTRSSRDRRKVIEVLLNPIGIPFGEGSEEVFTKVRQGSEKVCVKSQSKIKILFRTTTKRTIVT